MSSRIGCTSRGLNFHQGCSNFGVCQVGSLQHLRKCSEGETKKIDLQAMAPQDPLRIDDALWP